MAARARRRRHTTPPARPRTASLGRTRDRDAERVGLLLQRRAQGPITDDHRRRIETAHGLEENIDTLVGHQASDEERDESRTATIHGLRRTSGCRLPNWLREPERNDDCTGTIWRQRTGMLEQGRRRNDDACGSAERERNEWMVEGEVAPPRADDFAVIPDDEPVAGTGDRIRQQGHRIRLVQDEQVAVIAAKQRDQCRGHRHRSDAHEQTGARDRHAVDFLAHRRPLGGHDEGPAVDAARALAFDRATAAPAPCRRAPADRTCRDASRALGDSPAGVEHFVVDGQQPADVLVPRQRGGVRPSARTRRPRRPRAAGCARSPSTQPRMSSGETHRAIPPETSLSAGMSLITAGRPAANASITGSPNPSRSDGINSTAHRAYTARSTSRSTNGSSTIGMFSCLASRLCAGVRGLPTRTSRTPGRLSRTAATILSKRSRRFLGMSLPTCSKSVTPVFRREVRRCPLEGNRRRFGQEAGVDAVQDDAKPLVGHQAEPHEIIARRRAAAHDECRALQSAEDPLGDGPEGRAPLFFWRRRDAPERIHVMAGHDRRRRREVVHELRIAVIDNVIQGVSAGNLAADTPRVQDHAIEKPVGEQPAPFRSQWDAGGDADEMMPDSGRSNVPRVQGNPGGDERTHLIHARPAFFRHVVDHRQRDGSLIRHH